MIESFSGFRMITNKNDAKMRRFYMKSTFKQMVFAFCKSVAVAVLNKCNVLSRMILCLIDIVYRYVCLALISKSQNLSLGCFCLFEGIITKAQTHVAIQLEIFTLFKFGFCFASQFCYLFNRIRIIYFSSSIPHPHSR